MKILNNNDGLYERLIKHNNNDIYPMHMPGHKRNRDIMDMVNPYSIDITEIDDFDNMHNPTGIIKKIEEEISLLEAEDAEINEALSTPEVTSNFPLLTEKCNRLEEIKTMLDRLYEEYETLI